MSDSQVVLVSVEDGVGVLSLNRPEKFNCLSRAVIAALTAGLETLERDPQVRALVVCSAGKHFCTGADLSEVEAIRKNTAEMFAFNESFHEVLRRFEQSPLPVVGAVQGFCLAGGLETAMACDVVFAEESARIGDQHAQYGLVPGGGNSQRIPRVVGRRRALDLMFTARWLDAKEALEWGLVNYVVPDGQVRERAVAYGRKLAGLSAGGLAAIKRLVHEGLDMSREDGLALERRVSAEAHGHADVDEGLDAFRNKRTPVFGSR